LFVNRVGKPLNPEVLNTAFKKALAQSPVEKKATLHILRHSYATTMLQTGASVYQLMACLGHGSLTSTVRYLHLLQGDDIPFRKALDGLMSDLF
jgi:site-specific recombinase XerD